ncbi:MAG: hypothetical protein RDV41_04185 [Planctomycetota bacterium]|nr:hypothetical protein [Planctomycetota bacterium]
MTGKGSGATRIGFTTGSSEEDRMVRPNDELIAKLVACVEKTWRALEGEISFEQFRQALAADIGALGLPAETLKEVEVADSDGKPTRSAMDIVVDAKIAILIGKGKKLGEEEYSAARGWLRAAGLRQGIIVSPAGAGELREVIVPPFEPGTRIAWIQDSFPEQAKSFFHDAGLKCYDCAIGYEDDLTEVARQHEMKTEDLVSRLNKIC